MPWARLDDQINGNDKIMALTDSAFRLWVAGLVYCQANLTDGYIPMHALLTFGVRRRPASVARELIAPQVKHKGPLWHAVDGGYQIHDYLDWNDSREEVLKARAKAKERLTRFRGKNTHRNGSRNAYHDGGKTPFVRSSTPTPTIHKEPARKEHSQRRAHATVTPEGFETFWNAYPQGRRQKRTDAEKAWRRLDPDERTQASILSALEWQCRMVDWRKENNRFVPLPTSYLNARRWEDEPFDPVDPMSANDEAWDTLDRGDE